MVGAAVVTVHDGTTTWTMAVMINIGGWEFPRDR